MSIDPHDPNVYIQALQQRNRALKKMATKSAKRSKVEALEKGFQLNFSGANQERVTIAKEKRQGLRSKAVGAKTARSKASASIYGGGSTIPFSDQSNLALNTAKTPRINPNQNPEAKVKRKARKQWKTSSAIPPFLQSENYVDTNSENEYEDDFEADTDDQCNVLSGNTNRVDKKDPATKLKSARDQERMNRRKKRASKPMVFQQRTSTISRPVAKTSSNIKLVADLPTLTAFEGATSDLDVEFPTKPPLFHKVQLLVESVYNSEGMVGLTSLDLLNEAGQAINVSSALLSATLYFYNDDKGEFYHHSRESDDKLAVLFNNVKKTINPKNMWLLCNQNPSIRLVIELRFAKLLKLSEVKLWNYNKNLSYGVKRCKLLAFTDDRDSFLVFDSSLKKGCVNNVFDYSTSIPLFRYQAPVIASVYETEIASSSSDLSSPEPSPQQQQQRQQQQQQQQQEKPQWLYKSPQKRRSFFGPDECGKALRVLELDAVDSTELEESWDGLQRFQQHNLSRLGNSQAPGEVDSDISLSSDESSSDEDCLLMSRRQPRTSSYFKLPILPRGKSLEFVVLSTWGDKHYVGLNGIELFDSCGNQLIIHQQQVLANKTLQHDDPRTADKLLDHVNYTCDDLHMWLIPFSTDKNDKHSVGIELTELTTLSMIRIWNYNKNRIHSYRGVRHLQILLDGQTIFAGEIKKAPGALTEEADCQEVLLFTLDDGILQAVEEGEVTQDSARANMFRFNQERPTTCSDGSIKRNVKAKQPKLTYEEALKVCETYETIDITESFELDGRPKTAVAQADAFYLPLPHIPPRAEPRETSSNTLTEQQVEQMPLCSKIKFNFLDTYGDEYYLGLTGIEVLIPVPQSHGDGFQLTKHPLDLRSVRAKPCDINCHGHSGDPRTLDKLVDGVNVTCNDLHMWLIPFTPGGQHVLELDLQSEMRVAGVVVYNYNKNREDTRRGAKQCDILLDNRPLTSVTLRKAPGSLDYAFGQTILFNPRDETAVFRPSNLPRGFFAPALLQDYEPMLYPCGFVFCFELCGTYGDAYYVGLNSLELYDGHHQRIQVGPEHVTCVPSDVNMLAQTSLRDSRVGGNLFNGLHREDTQSWLAPLASTLDTNNATCSQLTNKIFVAFDSPVCISMIEVYNYSKTPSRGAREVTVWVDDLIVFRQELRRSRQTSEIVDDDSECQTLLFTHDAQLVKQHGAQVHYCGKTQQEVVFIDDNKITQGSIANSSNTNINAPVDLALRPSTGITR